jgi:plastocyanin
MHRSRLSALLLVLLFVFGACGSDDGEAVATNEPTTENANDAADENSDGENGGEKDGGKSGASDSGNVVSLKNLKFRPDEITIQKGETVTWKWDENILHNVTKKGDFQSENLDEGTFEHTFNETGEFEYTCTLHPGMDGTVTVE